MAAKPISKEQYKHTEVGGQKTNKQTNKHKQTKKQLSHNILMGNYKAKDKITTHKYCILISQFAFHRSSSEQF